MYDTWNYNFLMKKLRKFFQEEKSFVEVHTQSRLSILSACEDPKTISMFNFDDLAYPLPQTGQMWLEYELLKKPDFPGVFCVSTSYRNEPHPITGRHEKIFPMFEFESHGDINSLRTLEQECLEYLGFNSSCVKSYEELCAYYNTDTLTAQEEEKMCQDFGNIVSLEYFPLRTDPFWNMKHYQNNIYNKIDVILYGMETIGSAERSTNIEEMYYNFNAISDGKYAQILFDKFGETRVLDELMDYLNLPMFPRFGGGIGITRLLRAMKLANLLPEENVYTLPVQQNYAFKTS